MSGRWSWTYDNRIKRVLFYLGYRNKQFNDWILQAQILRIGHRMRLRDHFVGWLFEVKWWPDVKSSDDWVFLPSSDQTHFR